MDPVTGEFENMSLDEARIAEASGLCHAPQDHEEQCSPFDRYAKLQTAWKERQAFHNNFTGGITPLGVPQPPATNRRDTGERDKANPEEKDVSNDGDSDYCDCDETDAGGESVGGSELDQADDASNAGKNEGRQPPQVAASLRNRSDRSLPFPDGIPVWCVDGALLIRLYKRTRPNCFTTFTQTDLYDAWSPSKPTGLHPVELIKASAKLSKVKLKLDQKWVDKMKQYDRDQLAASQTMINDIAPIVREAQSVDASTRLTGVRAVRLLTIAENPPIDDLIQAGVLPVLVGCLKCHDEPSLQLEAAWALTNIAAGTPLQTQTVVYAGAVPLLIDLLRTPQQAEGLLEQSLWALANITGNGPQSRDHCVKLGLIEPLLAVVRPEASLQLLRHVAWILRNLCQSHVAAPPVEVVVQLMPLISDFIRHTDLTVLVDALWALSFLVDDRNEENIQMAIDAGTVPILTRLLAHTEADVQAAALCAVGGVVSGTDEQAQVVLSSGALAHLPALLCHARKRIRKNAIWCLSSVLAGEEEVVQSVVDAGLVSHIIHVLCNGELEAREHAAWAVGNLTVNGSKDHLALLVAGGALPPLFAVVLTTNEAQIVDNVSEGLRRLLRMAGATPAERLIALTGQRGARSLRDLCEESVLSAVQQSVSKVNKLPLSTLLIEQLKDALEYPSFYVRAKNFITANMTSLD